MRFRTRLTLVMTAILIVGGTLFMTMAEWANLDTLGAFDPAGRVLAGFFQAVMPGAMNTGTLLGADVLMFAGRLGPVTLASALVLREHGRLFQRPEGPPLIG